MKKLLFLTFLASPALAHQTPFDQPDFLQMSNGDPIAAQELSWFCAANGKSVLDCKASLSGNGNLKQEAARKCIRETIAAAPVIKGFNNKEIPGSRAHQAFGTVWHPDYREDADGIHRHVFTVKDRIRGVAQYRDMLIQAKLREKEAIFGSSEKSVGQGVNGNLEFGVSAGIDVHTTVGTDGSTTVTKINAKLSQAEMAEIDAKSKAAYDNPELGGVAPSVVCIKNEENCLTPDGSIMKNESYEPSKEKKESKEKKPKDKKGASNTPSHVDEPSADIPDNTTTAGGDTWVGNDEIAGPDDPMIATTVDKDLFLKSGMENCLDREFSKLITEIGSKTMDQSIDDTKNFEAEKVANLLRTGYCDVSFYGRPFCQTHKNRAASVVPVAILQEKKDAAQSALAIFKNTGVCNAQALGYQFCKAQKDRWTTTPADRIEVASPLRPVLPPIRTFPR